MRTPQFQVWSHFEERFSRSGEVPMGLDSNETIFRSIVKMNSARSSEAMAIQGKADPLLALRAYVYRGRLKEAGKLAEELITQESTQNSPTSIRNAEVLLEQSRILAMNGEWKACEELCSLALNLPEVAPVSQLTLFQIRGLARYETHQMAGAMADLERIDSLAEIFPNCPSAFYGAILRAKIIARDRSPQAGFQELNRIWNTLINNSNSNLDRVHALIRAEVDFGFLAKEVSPARLLASYRIAEITGEHLYLSLAVIEAARSGVIEMATHFEPLVQDGARVFPKIQKILNEIAGISDHVSVSGTTLATASASPKVVGIAQISEMLKALPKTSMLLMAKQRVVIHLNPFRLVMLNDQPQLEKALFTLSQGPVSMSQFFSQIWGRQKYSAELHANLISSLLYRLKKKTGASAKIVAGKIRLENTLVLE